MQIYITFLTVPESTADIVSKVGLLFKSRNAHIRCVFRLFIIIHRVLNQ